MAEIVCPTCGRSNPHEARLCQFCGAWLMDKDISSSDSRAIRAGERPVVRPTSEFEKVKPPAAEPIRPGETPTPKDTGELEKALPSWLQALRKAEDQPDQKAAAPEAPAAPSPEPEENPLDWLAGLGQEEEEEEIPDWLAALRQEPKPKPQEPSPVAPAASPARQETKAPSNADEEALPDWFTRLEEPQAPSATQASPAGQEESFLPDWLESLQGEKPTLPESEEPSHQEFAGWGVESGLPAEKEIASSSGLDDWWKAFETEPPSESGAEKPLSQEADWLQHLESELPSQVVGSAPVESEPDWLKQFASSWSTEMPAQEERGTQEDFVPDWLKQLETEAPSAGQPPVEQGEPDWLKQFAAEGAQASSPVSETPEQLPSWLEELSAEGKEKPAAGAPPSPEPAPPLEMPDWLSALGEETSAGRSSVPAFVEEVPAGPVEEETLLPDWLAEIQSEIPATPRPSEEPSSEAISLETPEWLAGIEAAEEASAGRSLAFLEGEAPASASEVDLGLEIPDWLEAVRPERGTETGEATTPESPVESTLEAAELPSWVQAMKPVEAVISTVQPEVSGKEGVTESAGPLRGLRGVIPIGISITPGRRSPAYFLKLQVSEQQRADAELLEKLVLREGQARPIRPAVQASGTLWRVLSALLLMVAIVLPLLGNTQLAPDLMLFPSEWERTQRVLAAIPPSSPILVVFDYDPAFFAEMHSAAAPVIDALLNRGARLTLISTLPTGPALAEGFLRTTQERHLQAGMQYVNLGYLPGGPAGIYYFASSPQQAAPRTAAAAPAWDSPALAGVRQLSDFAALLVLTDNADTARAWVEQTRQARQGTPLIMIVSAQVEPMVRPYFDADNSDPYQVQGMITGLAGGKAFEQTYGQPGLSRRYWDAFSLGLLTATLLMILGGVSSAVAAWSERKKGGKA